MANIIGPDVSFYQDDPETPVGIDFIKMRREGAGFVIIRAGQNTWTDRDFKANWREAKAAGIPRGSYWFYDSRSDPKDQADLWLSGFNGEFGELPLWCDFEENYGGQYRGWRHWYTFIERVKSIAPNVEVGVYTAYYYWRDNMTGVPSANVHYFKQYPLWIANYGTNTPLVPSPWTSGEWTLWQFTDNGDGIKYGVESLNIDLNYFNGDAAALKQRFKLSDTPIPEPLPLAKYYKVLATSLRVRDGAGLTATQIGNIYLNDVVEVLDANDDETWLKIRTRDGKLTGWSFAAYLERVGDSPPQPEPTPTPEPSPVPGPIPEPAPTSNWHRVTTASLRVRSGPSTAYPQIGSIKLDEIVEEIDANPSRSWINIRKEDGSLTGWCSADYLELTDAPTSTPQPQPTPNPEPTPEPTPPPDEDEANWYKVTATSLNVREGPGIEFNSLGLVYKNELVEELDVTSDQSWIKIRNTDGSLVGWSIADWLVGLANPPSEQPVPTPPVPESKNKNWYKVSASVLNVRSGPSLSDAIIGRTYKNDTIPGLDDTSKPGWVQIQKIDGLVGWCSKDFLAQITDSIRPDSVSQRVAAGITYLRKDLTSPRPIVVHVLAVDLRTSSLSLQFLVTPPSNSSDILCSRTTSQFLEEFKLRAAINGGYYSYLDSPPSMNCENDGEPVRISDYAASRGNIYSPKKTEQPVIYIKQQNQVSFNSISGKVFNAVSGDRMIVENGKVLKNLAAQVPNPRTAVGLSKNVRWLTLMVVDGRQPGYSEGVTFPELAELLISFGAHTGANMDGGGSSTMVIRGADGKAKVLNSPIHLNDPGKERSVGNHLGLLGS